MSTFDLYRKPDGRIVLGDSTPSDCDFIRSVSGAHWGAARDSLRRGGYDEFEHVPGYGYYEPGHRFSCVDNRL
jgi:hypothetical protein